MYFGIQEYVDKNVDGKLLVFDICSDFGVFSTEVVASVNKLALKALRTLILERDV